ncbi:NAD(P)/FAD-dependent oxidoreductase [Nocardia otitidiscaviarum]|uniref:NAD(P)/FAD-dependent oxidoreductase n=1 Tax=Nocardia otitidiscaviarum TaxID=1823 RepID=A0A516NM07_9NOCA|nr:NAD(P)/FAD-dependent oxidoreductase [Nocardia otitidiscaviarum]MCP9624924.1 NAD(P)/FAD-dependent oxidoreductase [Nocardia otitidiscaviarum]QDP79942.1 NAD(P)/FAD-dependent oxidoreductase [Nocardia otitidiscaviarum]
MTSRTVSVGIIGAGFGGVAAAIELDRHGIGDYTIFERGDSVGGVWRANSYPGAACDVPSPIYSLSYALETNWSRRFGTQPEIHDYLRRTADRFGVTPRIRFGTEVTAAAFEEDSGRWRVETAAGEVLRFDALICATGQLSRPRLPELPGMASFGGAQFHSAQWDHDVDLTGQRVAVVGSGASAVQVVPAIVDRVGELHVVQRSAYWVGNKWDHRTTRAMRAVLGSVPGLARLQHNIEWLWYESRAPFIARWAAPVQRLFELWLKVKMRREIRDPELRAAVLPTYRFGCNRVLLSNDWYPALDREHATLHPHGVEEVTERGLRLSDGSEVAADVIVWCTGFTASEYLAPVDITGRDGRKLHAEWKSGPYAHLGITVSGYPNLFLMFGPNTGSITNTITFMLEKQARYARIAIERIAARGGWLDVRREVQDAYNERLLKRLRHTVFTTGCPGWYHTEEGKVIAVWPGSHIGYARATRTVDFTEYEFGHAPAAV